MQQGQAFRAGDLEAAEGHQLAADTAQHVRIGIEGRFPVERLDTARVEIGQACGEQCLLVLVAGGDGAVVDILQQQQVRRLVADHSHHFVEGVGDVLGGGLLVRPGGIRQVVPEHVALAGEELDVPGHHLQHLAGLQLRRLGTAQRRHIFPRGGMPGEQVGEGGQGGDDEEQDQQYDA
ncbi:hypothetical protein D3C80_1485460 [compost metagenome]